MGSASAIIFAPSFLPIFLFLNYLFEVHCWTPNYSVVALVVVFWKQIKNILFFFFLLPSLDLDSVSSLSSVVSVVGVLHFARLALSWIFQRENLVKGVLFLGM